jgi:hypothetical protein
MKVYTYLNDVQTALSWGRATGAGRRDERGPYFTKISAGVLGGSHMLKISKFDHKDQAPLKPDAPNPHFKFKGAF